MESPFVFTPKAEEKPMDNTATLLFNALQQYRAGHHKAAMAAGASALNLMSAEHDIAGGGWV